MLKPAPQTRNGQAVTYGTRRKDLYLAVYAPLIPPKDRAYLIGVAEMSPYVQVLCDSGEYIKPCQDAPPPARSARRVPIASARFCGATPSLLARGRLYALLAPHGPRMRVRGQAASGAARMRRPHGLKM